MVVFDSKEEPLVSLWDDDDDAVVLLERVLSGFLERVVCSTRGGLTEEH